MDLNLKGMDESLVSRAKMAAYGQEQTLKEWVIEAITEKLARKVTAAREAKAAGETAPQGPRGKASKGGVKSLAGETSKGRTGKTQSGGNGEASRVVGSSEQGSPSGAHSDTSPASQSKIGQTPQHDTKTCRLHGCGMCRVLGVKDAKRGLA